MAQHLYGIDLGTSNFKIYSLTNKKTINEKNVIAKKNRDEVFQYGDPAFEMYEKAPANIEITFPVKFGVIADIRNMDSLFECFFKKLNGKSLSGSGDFCIAVPTDITEVEKRAFYDMIAESRVRAKHINVVEKPIADAVGVGIDVDSPKGNLIVNIGSDTTEISVISLGGIVLSKLIKTGGSKLDESICSIVRKKYNLIIGRRTAEQIKINLADAMNDSEDTYVAYGRNIVTGLPTSKEISSALVYEAISEHLHSIIDSVKVILERTPPELAADIISTGVYLTGGSSQINNLDTLFNKETGLDVNTSEDPEETVIRGIAEILSDDKLSGLMYVPREKQYN
ncbi:MAG: rod shape-determining protein [Lachnospiraceae bacterium]|nr:rod shape-determining protein [Lachnospiraceae bacterium]